MAKLTEEDRKRICLEVLESMMPSLQPIEEYSQEEGDTLNTTMKSATVLENCQVNFQHGLAPMALIECDDKRVTFYLAEGDDTHVFVLRSNPDGTTYSFMGGMMNVTYNLS